ncbi:DUF3108 domain-containing protein [Ramlibacter sp. MMS24-I3-19]|uniref:DUF3108 domain-containing protein n=1 Tax=Ramlibacter sp. MMS24-I3-19 TaxID=3416606 RepID=UPI003D04E559
MTPAAGVPWRPLVAVTTAVLCVHMLALHGLPRRLTWRPAPPHLVFELRAPQASAAVQAPAPVPARADDATPTPASVATPSARPLRSAPRGTSTPSAHRSSSSVTIPASITWRYAASGQWRGSPVAGDATLAWLHEGSRYEAAFTLAAPPLPAREQHSAGDVAADGLRPRRFAERQRSEQAAHFDRDAGRIAFSSNRPQASLQPGGQDRLSLLVQLPALAGAHPERFAPGMAVSLQVAGTREADEWRFTVEGAEDLALPAGTVHALRLTRVARGLYDPRLELWLAPGHDYALVRLRLTPPGGDWLDLQWSGTDKR